MLAANTLSLAVILCSLGSFAQDVQEKDSKCPPTDIGFLLDYSDTINRKNFYRSKTVIKMLVRDFKVGVGGSRAGLINFSDRSVVSMPIGTYPTASEFNTVVDKIKRKGGRTRIDEALKLATYNLFGTQYLEDPNIKNRVLFVVTDGHQSRIYKNRRLIYPNLRPLVRDLSRFRVRIIVVAVGDHPKNRFLIQMARKEKYIARLTTRARIRKVVKKAYSAACRKPQQAFPKECSKKIDLGFALDASGSIGKRDFNDVRNFVINVLKKLDLSKTETHAGVIVYSTKPRLLIKLNQFYNLKKFSDFLNHNTPWPPRGVYPGWMKGFTGIDKALNMSHKELFSEKNGDRPEVRNVLVFLTDGEQRPPLPKGDSLENYSKPLKEAGVEIMAVGFGKALPSELIKIASSPKNVRFNNGSAAEALTKAVEQIVENLCNYCQKKVNLGIVLDASGTTTNSFDLERELTKSVVEGFSLKELGSQVTLITFSNEAKVNIKFTSDTWFFKNEVDFVPSVRGRTNIFLGLREAEKEFRLYAYKDVPKILIVMTDGKQSSAGNIKNMDLMVKEEADKLRAQGFTIVAVTIGVDYNTEVINYIAGSEDNIVKLTDDKSKLIEYTAKLVSAACPGKTLEPSYKASDQVDDIKLLDEMENTMMQPYIS